MNNTTITQQHIEDIDSEITWKKGTNILGHVDTLDDYFYAHITLSNGYELEVYFNDESLYELLEEKFLVRKSGAGTNTKGKIYFNSKKLERAYGIFDDITNEAYIEGDGFGIFKSAISGLATLLGCQDNGILPVHGSAIYSDSIGGVSLIGAHRVGKTTGLLNIAHILGEGNIISDDWLQAQIGEKSMSVSTTDNSISLSTRTVQENPHIPQLNTSKVLGDVKRRKTSYKPSDLLGSRFIETTSEIEINSIILLVTGVKDAVTILGNDITNVPSFITGATYHFPYYTVSIRERHKGIWQSGLERIKPKIIVFDHSHFEMMVDGYATLVDILVRGKK
ncbi:hypothetical protein LAT59_04080 [Candidatus Gracilibacteria bacterium]|nr:hypothetical protein [Candidatus Gracilibacteria bacterium]